MSPIKVTVLGASGMLGAMVIKVLSEDSNLMVTGTVRDQSNIATNLSNVTWKTLDAETATLDQISEVIGDSTWVVNAIGIIKPYIHDDNAAECERAIRINGLFPHLLAKAAEKTGAQVLQIATDCVYSGAKGNYVESDVHDALDVYGKTKSLGEVPAANMHHLRCSIIGPEIRNKVSLLEWFLGQPEGATVNGYTNHHWNGVTTHHYAKVCRGIIKENLQLGHLQHVIPGDRLSKADLLGCFAEAYDRTDITINPTTAEKVIDRTVETENEELNQKIWQAAGYATPPTLKQMVDEMAAYGPLEK